MTTSQKLVCVVCTMFGLSISSSAMADCSLANGTNYTFTVSSTVDGQTVAQKILSAKDSINIASGEVTGVSSGGKFSFTCKSQWLGVSEKNGKIIVGPLSGEGNVGKPAKGEGKI